MSRRIPFVGEFRTLDGYPFKVTQYTPDGDVDWEPGKAPDESAPEGSKARLGTPKLKVANTYDMLREVARYLSQVKALYRTDDERRIDGLFNQIDAAEERAHQFQGSKGDVPDELCAECKLPVSVHPVNAEVILGDKSYAWFQGVLVRRVPLPGRTIEERKENKEQGTEAHTFRFALWNTSAVKFSRLLSDPKEEAQDVRALED